MVAEVGAADRAVGTYWHGSASAQPVASRLRETALAVPLCGTPGVHSPGDNVVYLTGDARAMVCVPRFGVPRPLMFNKQLLQLRTMIGIFQQALQPPLPV